MKLTIPIIGYILFLLQLSTFRTDAAAVRLPPAAAAGRVCSGGRGGVAAAAAAVYRIVRGEGTRGTDNK